MGTIERARSASAVPTGTWRVDPVHSHVGFAVRHMAIATVRGRFKDFSGTLDIDESGAARARGWIAAASIDTGDPNRDKHLRSPDFLDVERHPEIRLDARSTEPLGARAVITGYLRIRDLARLVDLDVTVHGAARDPAGNERVALELRGEIEREAFGVSWNQALETGGLLVGSTVKLDLDLSLVRDDERRAA